MNMTIDDIRETDLEPCLDALLNDAFKLADTIIERSSDEDSDNYQCGQRQYDSDKDSSNTMPLLAMEDIRSMSDMDTGDQSLPSPPTQHAPQPDPDADFLMGTISVSHISDNTSTKRPSKNAPGPSSLPAIDTSDGLCVASKITNISNVKNESIVINSDSDNTPPKTVKKRRINQYFSNNKKHC
ncbi:hypothetical protein DPMN_104758 [Dreissena polymorpha]|uniref:Uncharacterized protein n=1 Tax=Dreissena polymorpha TaxID=45954 RepID=A0A9D4HAK2_DREPO|nr:hypothetical protein DPMN_104758 [Dreissena polymorpha]